MKQNFIVFIILMIIILSACQQKQAKVSSPKVVCDSCCLKKLAVFADTLTLDTSKLFNYYFDKKKFYLDNCDLKKYRGNDSLKASLVLLWLKIDNVYLKHRWSSNYVEEIGSISTTANQIVYEFYFLSTGKESKLIEHMEPSWSSDMVDKDPSLLKNSQIKKLFEANKLLRKHIQKAKIKLS